MSDSEKPSEEDEPKLVVDTDWKEQVAKEKEAAANQVTEDAGESAVASGEESEAPESPDAIPPSDMPAPPPATFEVLLSMMFTQAMAMLGQMPDPASGEVKVNKPYAKHYIDTLEMLGEKTSGNLNEDEEKMLSEALHALRMMYVNAKLT